MNTQPSNPFDINVDEENQQKIDDNLNTEDELFESIDDNEDDGDLVWVIQKTIWSIVKSLLFLLIIGGSIWVIWGGGVNFSWPKIFNTTKTNIKETITETKTKKSYTLPLNERNTNIKEKEISIIKDRSIAEKNPSALLVRWSFWMHRTQTAIAQNEIEKTLKWQLEIQNYLGNDVLSHIKAPTLFERTKKVSVFENRLKKFQIEGQQLKQILIAQLKTADNKLLIQTNLLADISNQLDAKLASKNYFGFENLLQKKYTTAGQVEIFTTKTRIRRYLLNDIQTYQVYLNDIEKKLIANKAAILSDIKVTPFSNDPFERLKE